MRLLALVYLPVSLIFLNCGEQPFGSDIPSDRDSREKGTALFESSCMACHDFEHDGIGPRLGGITKTVSSEWLKTFITSPQSMIESGDERAVALFTKHKVYMPSFSFSEEELTDILAYIHTFDKPQEKVLAIDTSLFLDDPISDTVLLSDLVVDLTFLTEIPASSDKRPLARIAKMTSVPGGEELFVSDLRGTLYQLADTGPHVFLNLRDHLPDFVDQPGLGTGLGSFAFHPEYAQNGRLYITHTELGASAQADFALPDSVEVMLQWVLTEWTSKDPTSDVFSGTFREVLRIDMAHVIHGVQEIAFKPEVSEQQVDYGLLYMGIGDGGSVIKGHYAIPDGPTQAWGSIFRIDPQGKNSRNGQYGIPSENPFVEDADERTLGELYAHGFRNPNRFSWDVNGRLFASDIGERNIEEVNEILPGRNYGWPHLEGTFVIKNEITRDHVFPLSMAEDVVRVTWPVLQYDHDEGQAICGGYQYKGDRHSDLLGKYFFGDIGTGRLFYAEVADFLLGSQASIYEWRVRYQGEIISMRDLCGSNRVDLRIQQDQYGELYLLTKTDGKIYKFEEVEVL